MFDGEGRYKASADADGGVTLIAIAPGKGIIGHREARSAFAAAEADRNLKLFFGDNTPQRVVDLFTNYRPVE